MTQRTGKDRIETIHCLRGLAALAVSWYHFSNGNPAFLGPGLLQKSGYYGWLGVEVFFVISGFILPYALHSAGYQLSFTSYRRFLTKRIIRLEPPYLAAIAVVIVVGYASAAAPGFQGAPFHLDPWRVLAHLGYMTGFLKYQWLNIVFWTLAIEFQFYLSIGLLYPLLCSTHRPTRLGVLIGLAALAIIPTYDTLLTHYLFLFLIGIITFQYRSKLSGPVESAILLVVCALGAAHNLSMAVAVAGVLTSAAILKLHLQNKVLHFLGTVSYSLYLLHVPIGGRVINLGARVGGGYAVHVGFLAGATAVSVLAAYVMYRLVEKPSQSLAGGISLKPPARTQLQLPDGAAPVQGAIAEG